MSKTDIVEDAVLELAWTFEAIKNKAIALGLEDISPEELMEFIDSVADLILDAAEEAGNDKLDELLQETFADRVEALAGLTDDDE